MSRKNVFFLVADKKKRGSRPEGRPPGPSGPLDLGLCEGIIRQEYE